MRTVSVRIEVPVDDLAQAVAEEISFGKRRNSRAAILAAQLGMPGVNDAIEALIVATEKVDNAQHTRGESAALQELFKAAKKLRMAFRFAQNTPKEPKQ